MEGCIAGLALLDQGVVGMGQEGTKEEENDSFVKFCSLFFRSDIVLRFVLQLSSFSCFTSCNNRRQRRGIGLIHTLLSASLQLLCGKYKKHKMHIVPSIGLSVFHPCAVYTVRIFVMFSLASFCLTEMIRWKLVEP